MKVSSWTQGVTAFLAIALAAPCWAGETPTPLAVPSVARPLQAATQARLATADTGKATRYAQATGAAASESKPFFKSTKGLAVAVLMVGGVAWVVASRHSDKVVHSPAK